MYVFYENVQQCFVIKVLFGFKEQKLTQPDLKRNKYCKDAAGNEHQQAGAEVLLGLRNWTGLEDPSGF